MKDMLKKRAFQFTVAYHPYTNGQKEVVNRSLEHLLKCLISDHLSTWNLVIPILINLLLNCMKEYKNFQLEMR